ncbi:hypothetical protein [Glycomyces paridis]|uniref:DUF4878 domain-containing protein n=1 Tax=Glycomyces paridis TaxID=2126555 RepID=A0A4S8PQP2_9ACTN|nr:hypothetical protein [Glycomyces paridis]THV30829.1 hypothetical protein E9998_05490 [Glycomyces paridis]
MLRAPLAWARPRRWSILVEAALAVLLVLVALPFAVFGGGEPAPVAVVRGYLEALREGDVERAEGHVSQEYAQEADRSWLTAEAMSSDWEIESVSMRTASATTVHVVIGAGGRSAEGAFRVEEWEGETLILNPYLYLTSTAGRFETLEVNGDRREVESNADGVTLPVALYPGSYALFASAAAVTGEGGVPLLAVPGGEAGYLGNDRIDLDAVMTGPLVEGDAAEDVLNEKLAAWLDECAESGEIAPAGCPFSAAYEWGVAYAGATEFQTVEELDWEVAAYPRVRFGRDLRLEVVERGWLTLTGSGTTLLGDEPTAVDGECSVDAGNIAVDLGGDGGLTLRLAYDQANTC